MATAEEILSGIARQVDAPAARPAVRPEAASEWLAGIAALHVRRIYTLLYRMVGNAADAEDLAQEVFLKAYQRREQLRESDRVLPWLMRIASNRAIDFLRARPPEVELLPLPFASSEPGPEQRALLGEREKRLRQAMRLLSPKERMAIVLREIEGFSGAEVARALGCSQITVRTHIASARIKLRRILSDRGRRSPGGRQE